MALYQVTCKFKVEFELVVDADDEEEAERLAEQADVTWRGDWAAFIEPQEGHVSWAHASTVAASGTEEL